MATQLYLGTEKPISQYYDRKSKLSQQEYFAKLKTTATVYVGNLSIGTSEDSIYTFFEQAGKIKALHMGNNNQGVPAGFCFIEFETHEEAFNAVEYLSFLKLEDRPIRVDYDVGYDPSRQVGRGQNGIQVRDQMRGSEDKQRLNADKDLLRQQQSQFNRRGGLGNSNRGGFQNSFNTNNNRNYNNKYNNNGYNNNRYNNRDRDSNNYRGNYNNNRNYNNRSNSSNQMDGQGYRHQRQQSYDNQQNNNQRYNNRDSNDTRDNRDQRDSNVNQKRNYERYNNSRSVSQERERNTSKKVQYEQDNDNNDIDYNSD